LTTSPRKAPAGLVFCSIAFLLFGLVFLVLGVLFLVAPASLRDAGFGQDVTFGGRVVGLLMFAGFGALLAWPAWGLIRFIPFALQIARGLGLAFAALSVKRIANGDASPLFDWPVVVVGLAMAGYLSLPSVRALFRRPGD